MEICQSSPSHSKKKSSDLVSPRTINCFSAKSLPFEALFSIGTHIAFFSPSLLPGLPRAFVPVKPTPLSKVDGRDCVPIMAQIETPRDCKYAIALHWRQDNVFRTAQPAKYLIYKESALGRNSELLLHMPIRKGDKRGRRASPTRRSASALK